MTESDSTPVSKETASPTEHARRPEGGIQANTYWTKRVDSLGVGDRPPQEYHLVKGGFKGETLPGGQTPTYAIYYQPETGQWLKTIPMEGRERDRAELTRRLREGTLVSKRSLELSGFPDLAEQVVFLENGITLPDGKVTSGQLSPHIGISLEQLFLEATGRGKPDKSAIDALQPQLREQFGRYYQAAWNIALQLYLDHGYWTDDPNPGNLLVATDAQGNNKIVLIDFAGNQPIRDHLITQKIPSNLDQFPPERRPQMRDHFRQQIYTNLMRQVADLYLPFQRHCNRLGLPFSFDTSPANGPLHEYVMRLVDTRFPLEEK